MGTTAEIKGLFSKEHIAIVLLVLGSYYMNNKTASKVEEMSKELAKANTILTLLNYQINEETKLSYATAHRQERKSKYQAFLVSDNDFLHHYSNHTESGYRVYQTGGNPHRYDNYVCGS